jgi:anti-anti-sigma regulatory factor
LADLTWSVARLLDKLGLYTAEMYAQSREDISKRQTQELLELSTPVAELWDGILLLPLIGTLDSERTQTVMENLLNHIVKSRAEIAIIDITGVPTVDTLVAQHLIKTVSAARLMGADCIISGIRPQIAQTIVHLGLQLDVVSKATMGDAFALALKRTGQVVSNRTRREASVTFWPASRDRCCRAYKSSPLHWKRYAVREVLGMRPPPLRDEPGCHDRSLAQERSGSLEKVVALRSDAMHSSSDVKTKSTALRLKRTNLHPKPPIVRRGSRRQTRVVLCPCKRAAIGRAAAIDINSFSHLYSWLGVKARIACGVP